MVFYNNLIILNYDYDLNFKIHLIYIYRKSTDHLVRLKIAQYIVNSNNNFVGRKIYRTLFAMGQVQVMKNFESCQCPLTKVSEEYSEEILQDLKSDQETDVTSAMTVYRIRIFV